jgi:hypothetical protein
VSNAGAALTILASAIIVLTGLAALTRSVWKVAQDIRDNKRATQENTHALGDLSTRMDGRITLLEQRMNHLEQGPHQGGGVVQ